ncbi:recombinase family protein [Mesorhizobium sp. B2-4-16]|nr:recombinase family protein [Mesorhizobium sp. B2-4-16]TPL78434.1 recombinase family protein [Mesorhizobium sp. B2-4-3]
MARAAIYARFSTNLQSDRSIDDQAALCRAHAIQNGYELAKVYSDAAKSGASMHNRDGIRDLMADAMMGQFEVVIVEALDRLSRDMEDLAGISKRLKFLDIDLVGVHDGKASTVTVGLRGLVGQLFREDNAHKVRRGLAGRVAQGLSGGGQAYGYRPDPLNKGKMIIVDDEAEVIRRVFREYADGLSPRQIAYGLNKDRIAPPRDGARWNASTIVGSAKRANGILHNSLYVGVRVWNRVTMIKDPDTGRRVSRPNPESEWKRVDVPELRIVPQDLWEVAQGARREHITAEAASKMRRPKRLLSGLLKCGACGAGMSTMGADKTGKVRVRCTAAHESGTCPDPRTFYLDTVEKLVVGSLVAKLHSHENLATYIAAYQEERQRLIGDKAAKRIKLERDLEVAKREMSRVVDQIAKGFVEGEEVADEIRAIRERRKGIETELAMQPEVEKVVTFLPAAAQRFEAAMRNLHEAFRAGGVRGISESAGFLREIISTATLFRKEDGTGVEVEIRGHLQGLLSSQPVEKTGVGIDGSGGALQALPTANKTRTGVWGSMVAGEGLEPPTPGL